MLKNKVIVVTGGAGQIGREFVSAILQNDGVAIIADKDESQGNKLKEKISAELNTTNLDFVKIDITSINSLSECIHFIDEKYQRIDALVNNAYPKNKNFGKHFFDVKYNDFIDNLGLHLGGYFTASQQFAEYFQKQGHGNIVNIASIYGVIAPKFEIYNDTEMTSPIDYAVIKSGLIHLTRYMAKYFKGENIRVNAISPGGIYNNQPELFLKKYNNECSSKGMLDAHDLTGTLIFLLSDGSRYVNGQNIVVDDGFCL